MVFELIYQPLGSYRFKYLRPRGPDPYVLDPFTTYGVYRLGQIFPLSDIVVPFIGGDLIHFITIFC